MKDIYKDTFIYKLCDTLKIDLKELAFKMNKHHRTIENWRKDENSIPQFDKEYMKLLMENKQLENDKMKNMGASAPNKEEPQDEIVHVVSFVLQDQHEKEFWANCYLAAVSLNIYENPPEFIADRAILELRKRQEIEA